MPDLNKAPIGAINLTKGAKATIPLTKGETAAIVATLEWDGGSGARRQQGADLDLYALYVPKSKVGQVETSTTTTGVFRRKSETVTTPVAGEAIYYRNLGNLQGAPYIKLDGDATVPGIETIRITRPEEQGYVLICAYSAVENGVGSFKSYGAKAVVTDGKGSTVTAPLYHDNEYAYWVAIALVDFTDPEGVTISHVERYSGDGVENRPELYSDGTFEMDKGPQEFKTH